MIKSLEVNRHPVSPIPDSSTSHFPWLTRIFHKKTLPGKEKLTKRSYIPLVDDKIQYTIEGEKSSRHLVINNLPGTIDFCPLIRKVVLYCGADDGKKNHNQD